MEDLIGHDVVKAITETMERNGHGDTDCNSLSNFFDYWRSLEGQETRFQEQLAALQAQLAAKDTESNQLCYRIEELQRDFVAKSSGMDRLQAELVAAHQESQCVRQKLRLLENDVADYRQKNVDLADELLKRSDSKSISPGKDDDDEEDDDDDEDEEEEEDNSEQISQLEATVKEMEEKMKELKKELEEIRVERDQLEEERAEMEAEREEEMKIVQDALEEVNEEKTLIRTEFETFRTVNTDREQKLLDDFEWKLREVEKTCKKRLEEKEKKGMEAIKSMEAKIKEAEQQLKELEQLRAYETEVLRLRDMTRELQRSLRHATNKTEELQVSELILKEEVSRLRQALDKEKSTVACITVSSEKRLADLEKRWQARLDSQKSEMTDQWEHRLRRECLRVKTELDLLHEEEKHLALEALKIQKDQEAQTNKQGWERRLQDCMKEVSTLKGRIAEKEEFFQKELDRTQTNADRDILELRRKMDKMDMSYQSQIEKLNENHEKEMEQLNWEVGRKIQQLEQNYQVQNSSTRTTLELVKEQMERDAQTRLEAAAYNHQIQLQEQWERLIQEKEEEMQQLEEKHLKQLQKLKDEFEGALKNFNARETGLVSQNANLQEQLQDNSCLIGELTSSTDLLHGNVQELNQQMSNQSKQMIEAQEQADTTLREREQQWQTEQRTQLAQLREQQADESLAWQTQYVTMQQELSLRIDSLSKRVFEYEQQMCRPEDTTHPVDLQQAISEGDNVLANSTNDATLITDPPQLITEQDIAIAIATEDPTLISDLQQVISERQKEQANTTKDLTHVSDPNQVISDHDKEPSSASKEAISAVKEAALISDLQRIISKREQELAIMTEEKNFYERELLNQEESLNSAVSQSISGVLKPARYNNRPKKKGGGRGGTSRYQTSPLARSPSQPDADTLPHTGSTQLLSRSRSMEYTAIKVPSKSPIRKAKKPLNGSHSYTISTL